MMRWTIGAVALLLVLVGGAPWALQEKELPPSIARQAIAQSPFGVAPPGATAPAQPPPAAGSWAAKAIAAQKELKDQIADLIVGAKNGGTMLTWAVLMAAAFVYGGLHAAGPGHGKMVVASYFVARRERWLRAVAAGFSISLIQGIAAVAIVGLLAAVFHLADLDILGRSVWIEVICYGAIVLIGLSMLVQSLRGHAAQDGPDHGHEHGHGHGHEHGHGHGHEHGHAHLPDNIAESPWRLIVAAGLVPCASAIIIMLFALANEALWLGIQATFALSLGMGATVATIGLATVFARDWIVRVSGGDARRGALIERGLGIAGALLLIFFAGGLAAEAWSRL